MAPGNVSKIKYGAFGRSGRPDQSDQAGQPGQPGPPSQICWLDRSNFIFPQIPAEQLDQLVQFSFGGEPPLTLGWPAAQPAGRKCV